MIDGVHYVRAVRAGKPVRWYVYAWRGGPCILKATGPVKPRLGRADLEKLSEALASRSAIDTTSFLSLIREWRSELPGRPSSPEWETLSAGTKKTWGSQLRAIEGKWGQTTVAAWSDPRMVAKVVAWRDSRAATPRGADLGVSVLRALLEFGRLRGRVSINVADGIPALYKNGQRAEIVWTQDEIDRFCVAALQLDKPHLIDGIWLAALTGLRRQDLVTLTRAQIGEFAISKKALKESAGKRRRVTLPRVPALDDLLAELDGRYRQEGVDTVLVNSRGRPWSGDGFGGSFNEVRDLARIAHHDEDTGEAIGAKHLHDVRGTFVTRLLTDTDLTDREIADVMGWAPERVGHIRRVYVDDARVIVALGERIRDGAVKRAVKRSSG